jgi:hypothetical protein
MNDSADFNDVWNRYWELLYGDLNTEDDYPNRRPLLAHYTSLQNVENILVSGKIWLSNPLLMNDLEEVRFGLHHGLDIVRASDSLSDALGTDQRRRTFHQAIDEEFETYGSEIVHDLYVTCFCVHEREDGDGLLSMWRGYGNRGKGAAIVFDTSVLPLPETTPMILGPVWYGTEEQRKTKITEKVNEVAAFIRANMVPDEYVGSLAVEFFERLCLFSVFTKHIGFREENEWRLVYWKSRDQRDSDNAPVFYEKYFDYFNGADGIQPKLKLPVDELLKAMDPDLSLLDLVHSIIIGPTSASPLVEKSVARMLKNIGKPNLIEKVRSSTIPFRG